MAVGAKGGAGSINNSISEEPSGLALNSKKIDTTRGGDGELQNTRGLENEMLLQQQKNIIDNQDKALEKISGVVD